MNYLHNAVRLLVEASKVRQEIAMLAARNGNAPRYLHDQAEEYEKEAMELALRADVEKNK